MEKSTSALPTKWMYTGFFLDTAPGRFSASCVSLPDFHLAKDGRAIHDVLIMANFTPIAGTLRRRASYPGENFVRLLRAVRLGLLMLPFICASSAPTIAQDVAPPKPARLQAPCRVTVSADFSLDCSYVAGSSALASTPHLRLVQASLSFDVKSESYMSLSLTITNEDTHRLEQQRPVFLVIDDTKGMNYVRRLLPHVDLGSLKPNETRTFSERLLVPAFNSGDYVISLWIPSSDPGETYKAERNFLLVGETVANETTRLNELAHFTVKRTLRRKPRPT